MEKSKGSRRFLQLIFGLFLYAMGIVFTLNARIGYSPWDVFHVGFSDLTGLSIGTVSILTGVLIGSGAYLLGEKIGLGTLLNMILIGVFVDLLLNAKLIPVQSNIVLGALSMLIGLAIIALASYFYIGSGYGAGPRDSLMVALNRKTRLPIGACRGSIEGTAVAVGWLMGGMVGAGTVLSALLIGPIVQFVFRLFRFDASKVVHESLDITFSRLKKR